MVISSFCRKKKQSISQHFILNNKKLYKTVITKCLAIRSINSIVIQILNLNLVTPSQYHLKIVKPSQYHLKIVTPSQYHLKIVKPSPYVFHHCNHVTVSTNEVIRKSSHIYYSLLCVVHLLLYVVRFLIYVVHILLYYIWEDFLITSLVETVT